MDALTKMLRIPHWVACVEYASDRVSATFPVDEVAIDPLRNSIRPVGNQLAIVRVSACGTDRASIHDEHGITRPVGWREFRRLPIAACFSKYPFDCFHDLRPRALLERLVLQRAGFLVLGSNLAPDCLLYGITLGARVQER